MPFQLNLKSAEETRIQITKQQQKYIEKLYTDLAKKIEKEAQKAPKTATDYLRREFLNDLRESVDKELTEIRHLIQNKVEDSMEKTAESVVKSNREFLKEFDLPFRMALAHIPPDVVREVATGQLYEGNWSLARQLWKQEKHTQSDINKVIAEGIAANKSAYDIAKDLEKYVDPKAKKEWDWSKVYPGTSKKVDYNAQRLARTMVSHAYERAFVESTKDNPFVTEYEWRASGARTCPICADRDGKHFPKDDLPLDHPNGMCTFIAVIPDSYDEIADRLAGWANGVEDSALDKYAESLYGKEWNAQAIKYEYKISSISQRLLSGQHPTDEMIQGMLDDNEKIGVLKSVLHVSDDKASEYVDCIMAWSGNEYRSIRRYQQGKIEDKEVKRIIAKDEKTLEDYISKAPKWNGGKTYRAIGVKEKDYEMLVKSLGKTVDMLGTSSWSSDVETAISYSFEQDKKIIFVSPTQTKGTSIMGFSITPYEFEVLVSKNARYQILQVEEKKYSSFIYLEEIG